MWLHGDWAISLEKPKYWYEVVFLWNYWVFPEKKPMIFTGQGLVMSLTLFFMLDGYTTARLLVTLTLNPNLCCPPQDGNTYSPAGQSSSLLSLRALFISFPPVCWIRCYHPSTLSSRNWSLASAKALVPVPLDLVGIHVNLYIRVYLFL